jgi:hypothetical protein
MSRNVADRLRSLDVTTGRQTPAADAVAAGAAPGRVPGAARAGEAEVRSERGGPADRGAAAAVADLPARPGRGRPPRLGEPTQQTTIRLTMSEWADLQGQVTRETLARGERRYVVDIIRDAIGEYLARHG